MPGKYVYVKMKKTKPHEGGHWPQKKKIEACTTWVACGSNQLTAMQCNIPLGTIELWKRQQWWKDMVEDLRNCDNEVLDNKLTKAMDKALEQIMDRLENGEYVLDQKTGKVKQVPVKLRDSTVALNTLLDKRQLLRKLPTKITEQTSTTQQLKNLAEQFAQFVTGKKAEDHVEKIVHEFIDGETVEQDVDGKYFVKEN